MLLMQLLDRLQEFGNKLTKSDSNLSDSNLTVAQCPIVELAFERRVK